MTGFSNVDGSGNVDGLVAYLRVADTGMAAMKAYMASAARRMIPGGLIVDLGCGLGYDLVRLEDSGLEAIGFDSSMAMLTRLESRVPPGRVACADVAALPLRAASVDGCRLERVLQHVVEPTRVVDEMARVVRPDGCAFVLEPDYDTFRIESTVVPDGSLPASALTARNPRVGSRLAAMLEAAGFRIDDVVTEASYGYHIKRLPIDAEGVLMRAVAGGRADAAVVRRWLDEQAERSATGSFRGRWDKILVVATRR